MENIFNFLSYLFEPFPSGPFKYMNGLIVLAIITFIASIFLRIYFKKRREEKILRKLFRNLPGKLQLFALCEGAYILVRYERMAYLSMRFLHYLILAYGVYTVFRAAQAYVNVYPEEKKHRDHQLKLNQYLPRKKK